MSAPKSTALAAKNTPTRAKLKKRKSAVGVIGAAATIASLASPLAAPPPSHSSSSAATKPGVWRWAVKTMADPDATKVDTTHALPLKVADADDFSAPDLQLLTGTPRGAAPQEFSLYKITGFIVSYKAEDDGDYHVLISDSPTGSGPLLGTEIPRADFTGNSAFKGQIATARQTFEGLLPGGPSGGGSYHRPPKPIQVTIKGVGFWDETHGQKGLPSGFELHPVLSVEAGAK